ncbi:MAG: DUF2079 domain-containing protein [Deltaproteobacteria bacterium]|nr:DUF2079 domain-containing protein [Deltaproteobacteria bacterium]
MERVHHLLDTLLRVLPTVVIAAISLGATASLRETLFVRISFPSAGDIFFLALIIAVFILLYLVAVTRKRGADGVPLERIITRMNRHSFVLLVFPLFMAFDSGNISKSHPFLVVFLCASIAAISGIWWYRLPRNLPLTAQGRLKHGTLVSLAIVAAFATFYSLQMFQFQLSHHQALKTGNYDLGIYVNTLWNSAHGRLLECHIVKGGTHIFAHFDPILILLSPIMLINGSAEAALLLQTVWLALGAFPVFMTARHHLKHNGIAVAMSGAYLLYPALHGMTLYEFHSLALAGPPMIWAMYFIDTRRFRVYFVTLTLLLLIREDLSLVMFFVGFYVFVIRKHFKTGVATMLMCAVYYITVKLVFMSSDQSFSYDNYFSGVLVGNYSLAESLVIVLVNEPMSLLRLALRENKVLYLLQLLVPLAVIPVAGKARLITCVFGLAVTFLVSRSAVTDISYQYATFLYPFFFAMTPAILKSLPNAQWLAQFNLNSSRFIGAAIVAILCATVCMSYNFGAFHENQDFKAGHTRLVRSQETRQRNRFETVEKLKSLVPPDATVSASESIGPHFAIRETIFQFKRQRKTDYYLVFKNDVRKGKLKKIYNEFKKNMPYDCIFDEQEIELFIRKDLNPSSY